MHTRNISSVKSDMLDVADSVPPMSIDKRPNGLPALKERRQEGRLGWRWPFVFCFLRFPLFLGCFFIALTVFSLTGHTGAFALAQGVTIYDLPLIVDLICLLLLVHVIRKEGLRLRDLVNLSRKHFLRDLLVGIGLFMFVYVLLFALSIGSLFLIAGPSFMSAQLAQSLSTNAGLNPLGILWHIVISTILLPVSTGCVEELIYRGYVQPRLQVLTGNFWIALLVMACGFGLQHLAFGLTSWQVALAGFLTTFVAGLVFGVINRLNRQRLLPLMLIHWQANVISLGLAPLLLTLFLK